MAKPIKETPILEGKDAIKFLDNMKKSENNKLQQPQIAKMQENFSKLNSIVKVVNEPR